MHWFSTCTLLSHLQCDFSTKKWGQKKLFFPCWQEYTSSMGEIGKALLRTRKHDFLFQGTCTNRCVQQCICTPPFLFHTNLMCLVYTISSYRIGEKRYSFHANKNFEVRLHWEIVRANEETEYKKFIIIFFFSFSHLLGFLIFHFFLFISKRTLVLHNLA